MKWCLLLLGAALIGGMSGCITPEPSLPIGERLAIERARLVVPRNGLEEVYWKLTELNGVDAPLGSGGKEAHLLLRHEKSVARGFAGCNRFSGGYSLKGDQLSFAELASTKASCAEGMDLEAEFLSALAQVAAWSREGAVLSLRDAGGQVVARFVMRDL